MKSSFETGTQISRKNVNFIKKEMSAKKMNQPLTNVQLEMLKAFSYNLDDQELSEFKDLIAGYFAKRSIELADKSWEEKGMTEKDVDKLLETKLRKGKKD